jgi:hypothetical protein
MIPQRRPAAWRLAALGAAALLLQSSTAIVSGAARAAIEATTATLQATVVSPSSRQQVPADLRIALAVELRAEAGRPGGTIVTQGTGGATEIGVTLVPRVDLDSATAAVMEAGGSVANSAPGILEAYVPLDRLVEVAASPAIATIAPVRRSMPATSPEARAVTLLGADPWQAGGYLGTGIRVGIIDEGFSRYADLMGTAYAATVQARCYTSIGHFTTALASCDADGETHGTAVAETIASVAPGVSFYIANPISSLDERSVVAWMVSLGVHIINASWTSGNVFEGPGDGTSPDPHSHYALVDEAVAGGALWVNAAGNDGQEGWSGTWTDADGNGWLEFGPGDERNQIVLHAGEPITAALRWDDPWGASDSDYNLYLFEEGDPQPVASSEDPQQGTGNPVEVLDYKARAAGTYRLGVQRVSGSGESHLQLLLHAQEPLANRTPEATLPAPADGKNPGMLTVGAVDVLEPDAVHPYSGRGPTVDGRTRPDLVAPDCTPTATLGTFCGTSQAAPFVTGVAALLLQAQPGLTPADIAAALRSGATPLPGPVPDAAAGYGLVTLGAAPVEPPPPPGPPPPGTVEVVPSASASVWQAMAAAGEFVHLAYARGSPAAVAYQRSADGGASFGAATTLSGHGIPVGAPAIATAGSLVVVAWSQRGSSDTSGLWLRRSEDAGLTWKPAVRLAPEQAGLPSVAIDELGRVLVAWTDAAKGKILTRASGDAGETFQSIRTIGSTTRRSPSDATAFDGGLSTAASDSAVYVTWSAGPSKILLRRSVDGGGSWKPVVTVDTGATGTVEPWVAASGTSAAIVYGARPSRTASSAIYLRRTTDGGAHWTARRLAAGAKLASGAPVVTIRGAQLRLAFSECTSSACTRATLRYRQSSNGGASWSTAQTLSPVTRFTVAVGIVQTARVLVLFKTFTSSSARLATLSLGIR